MLHIAKIWRVDTFCQQVTRPLVAAVRSIAWMSRVANQRHALRVLDDRQLKDIGLSRADALHEANRPFWDVPPRVLLEGSEPMRTPSYNPQSGNRPGSRMPRAAMPSA